MCVQQRDIVRYYHLFFCLTLFSVVRSFILRNILPVAIFSAFFFVRYKHTVPWFLFYFSSFSSTVVCNKDSNKKRQTRMFSMTCFINYFNKTRRLKNKKRKERKNVFLLHVTSCYFLLLFSFLKILF